ncbi:AraC family transcriptional regulator [Enterococcus sp. 5H]|uniref:AraC family transcriptional regulator n=1 Tax=Enterococcus sp. 5H TaxID=1229490 RepID=UPI0023030D35|nr:AraC family transcriptional regulator [Enterococcus sp. 5H]MDA9472249.1 Transcriptional regulator, AraC family [Enterococcus sp. 5H]
MIQKLNQLVDYIEEHLDEELSLGEAAKILGLSEYHLKRTFSFIAGVSLGEYIRNRRLACANRDLVEGQTVTAVAFNYGYQSLEGFSRAFREWSGYLPSEVIKNKIQKSYPRLSFYVDVRGGVSMEFRIEQKNKFNLVGVKQEVPIQFEGKNEAIQKLVQSITEEQKAEMHKLTDVYPYQVLNASYDFDDGRMNEQGKLTHMIGIATTKENNYSDLQQTEIEEHTWAVFPNQGEFPRVLQETWGKIYSEWLPTSGYKLVEAPEISFTKFEGEKTELYSEIWIAVSE